MPETINFAVTHAYGTPHKNMTEIIFNFPFKKGNHIKYQFVSWISVKPLTFGHRNGFLTKQYLGKNSKSSQFYKTYQIGFKADIYPQYLYMNLQQSVVARCHIAAFQGMTQKSRFSEEPKRAT